MEHQVDSVPLDKGLVHDPGCVGNHFVYVTAAGNGGGPFGHGHDRDPLVGPDFRIGHYPDDQFVAKSAGLLEKRDMPEMEYVGHHVYVHSSQSKAPFYWSTTTRQSKGKHRG